MRGNGGNNGQGSNWCSRVKRLAIHLRDGMACVFCDKGVDDGKVLSLDHLWARINGGTNHPSNLVTACVGCNAGRRDRWWWVGLVPERRRLIDRLTRRTLDRRWASELLGRGLSVQDAARPSNALGVG